MSVEYGDIGNEYFSRRTKKRYYLLDTALARRNQKSASVASNLEASIKGRVVRLERVRLQKPVSSLNW